MLPHKLQFFDQLVFEKLIYKKKKKKTLAGDAFTQVTAFLANWFLRRRFLLYVSPIVLLCKNLNPNCAPPYSWDHDFNKIESTLSEDVSAQVSAFRTKSVLRRKFQENTDNFIYYFLIISPWRWMRTFILTNLNHHHQIMLCAKFS